MIHKVKYGMMEVVLASSLTNERAPDLTFKGADEREYAVFFAPYGTVEGEKMKCAFRVHCAPFEAEYSDDEAEALLDKEDFDAAA